MHRQVIVAGSQKLGREIPLSIRSEIAFFSCALAVNDHCGTWYQRSAGVAHGASDRSGVGCLAVHRQSAEREHRGAEQGAGRVDRDVPHQLVPPQSPKRGEARLYYSPDLRIKPLRWTWPMPFANPMAIRTP